MSNKAQLGMQRAAHHEAEVADLRARADAAAKESQELRARAVLRAAEIEEIQNRLAEIESDAERRGQEHDEEATVQENRRAALSEARRALEAALAEMGSATARIARIEAERVAAEHRRDDLRSRLDGLAGEDGSASERLAALVAEETALGEQVEAIGARVEAARQRVKDDEAALTVVRGELARGELELETLREEAHRRRSRLASLKEIQERYERFQSGVRAIMREHQQGQGARGIEGLVADIMRPPPELETAVEAVLGERLGNVIVESHEAGVEAIQFLKTKSEGVRSFIPRALRATRGEVLYDASGGTSTEPGRPGCRWSIRRRCPGFGRRRRASAGECWTSSATTGSTTRSPLTFWATCWSSRTWKRRWPFGVRRARTRPSSRWRARSSIRTAS